MNLQGDETAVSVERTLAKTRTLPTHRYLKMPPARQVSVLRLKPGTTFASDFARPTCGSRFHPVVQGDGIKTSRNYNSGIGEVLDIHSDSATFNAATYKPVITRIPTLCRRGRMGRPSPLRDWRCKGEATMRLLAGKRVKFPVQDDNAPAIPGQAEVREYQLIGVLGDEEVGQPSDIAEATWRP